MKFNMKTKILFMFVFFALSSCQEEGILTQNKTTTAIENAQNPDKSGVFVPTAGINVSGEVKIFQENNQYKLQLENFNISSGPDLKVYLSKVATPNSFVNLGNLTSATVYNIPKAVNIADYSHVLIHCQQYNHLFATAQLIKN